jgi:hypothetical protein
MITPVTLSSEYGQLSTAFGWSTAEFLACNIEALHYAFIDDDRKISLKQMLLTAYQ